MSARGIRLTGIWTHFAAADDTENALAQDTLGPGAGAPRERQAGLGLGPDGVRRHLAGSSGVFGADVARWDAVRIGIALYGLVPDALTVPGTSTSARGAPAARDGAPRAPGAGGVAAAGHGVSYGPTFVTARQSRITTPPGGLRRWMAAGLQDRTEALVRGTRVPLVGRVAMDAVMADVTDVGGPPVTEDDEFVLIGDQEDERIGALGLAVTGGTISYEVVAGHVPSTAPGVPCRRFTSWVYRALTEMEVPVARMEFWNGDICDLRSRRGS